MSLRSLSTAFPPSARGPGAVPTGRAARLGGPRSNGRQRMLPELPPRAARYVLAVDALAVLALVVAVCSASLRWRDIGVFAAFVFCGCVSVEGSRQLGSPASRAGETPPR